MASSFDCFLFLFLLFFFISPLAAARTPFHPPALVIPVSKDKCTHQHIIQIRQRTPPVPVKLTVDLGGRFVWVNCEEGYVSSSYKPAICNSTLCSLANSQSCTTDPDCKTSKPGCYKNTCSQFVQNRVVYIATGGEIGQDIISVQFFNEKNPGRIISVPDFPFVCGNTWLLDKLADGVTGMAGLGRTNISLPAYFSDAIGFSKKFAICLSSSTKSNGLIFFGDGPNSIAPNEPLIYTPLILNHHDNLYPGESADYYVGIKSIQVDGKKIKFDNNLLTISTKDGSGGSMLSTVNPYTVLGTSIYKALLNAFTKKLESRFMSLVVPSVPVPFGACYYSSGFGNDEEFLSTMPVIDLELESEKGNGSVYWRITGANSMVAVNSYTMCLAFIDGGSQPWTPIILGARQLEGTLIQFDVPNSKLGFSSNLSTKNTTCTTFGNSI